MAINWCILLGMFRHFIPADGSEFTFLLHSVGIRICLSIHLLCDNTSLFIQVLELGLNLSERSKASSLFTQQSCEVTYFHPIKKTLKQTSHGALKM